MPSIMEGQSDDWLWILEKEKCEGKNGNLMKENVVVWKAKRLALKSNCFVVPKMILASLRSCMEQTVGRK